MTVGVIGDAAHQAFFQLEPSDTCLFKLGNHLFSFGHNLRADAVAGQQK